MPIPLNAVAMIMVASIALAVLILLAYRWTISRQADYATIVRENDAAFQRVAGALGLMFVPGHITHHPMMGNIVAFGLVQGLYRDFHITLHVASEASTEPPVVFYTEITLHAQPGSIFTPAPMQSLAQAAKRLTINPSFITLEPRVERRARSMSYEFFTLTDSLALHTCIDALCDFGKTIMHVQDAS